MSEEKLLRELDERLNQLSVEGLWSEASEADLATYSTDPHTNCSAASVEVARPLRRGPDGG